MRKVQLEKHGNLVGRLGAPMGGFHMAPQNTKRFNLVQQLALMGFKPTTYGTTIQKIIHRAMARRCDIQMIKNMYMFLMPYMMKSGGWRPPNLASLPN